MLKSLGNVLLDPKIGLMFIDFGQPRQLRVNGLAAIDRSMRTRYLASALGIFLAAGQPRIAMSAVLEQDGLTLRIPASPTLVLRIDAAKSPHAEAGLTRAFLVEQGFRVPRLFRLARLARVADRDGQSEVIVFDIENADADFAPGPLAGADEDGDLALDAASKQAILERLKSAVHAVSQ